MSGSLSLTDKLTAESVERREQGVSSKISDKQSEVIQESKYASEEARESSFQGDWPHDLQFHVEPLAENGFYNLGSGVVQCFCCKVKIGDWKRDDEPWKIHAKISKDCEFLRRKYGKMLDAWIQLTEVSLENKRLVSKVNELKGELGTNHKEIKRLLYFVQESEDKKLNIQKQNKILKKELKEIKRQLSHNTRFLEEKIERECQENRASKDENRKLEENINNLTQNVQELRQQLNHTQRVAKNKEGRYHLLEGLCYRSFAEIEQLRAEKDNVTEILRRESDHACEMSGRIRQLEEQLSVNNEAISACLEFGYNPEMVTTAVMEWEKTHRYKAENLVKILMVICREAVVLPERQEVSSYSQNQSEANRGGQSEGAVGGQEPSRREQVAEDDDGKVVPSGQCYKDS